jgi:hypothetical protein
VWVQQTRHKIESLLVLPQICDPPILHVLPDFFTYRLDTGIHWWHGKFSAHVCRTQTSITVNYTSVELSPTHCPRADVDVSLKDFPPTSSETVLWSLLPLSPSPAFFCHCPYPGKWIVSVRVKTEHPVQPLLYLSISKPYQISSTDPPVSTVGW